MKTRITELIGITYPIIQASMAWITDADLAAAVSNAGGLGTIGPNAGTTDVTSDVEETGERLRQQIRRCRELTEKPFAVNFIVGVEGWDRKHSDRCVAVGVEENVPVAIVSQGNPIVYTKRLKNAGMKVIHVCSTVRHVQKAQEVGVDAVIVSGTEGGGHSGFDQLTTLCLVPQAAAVATIPVIAGGGIVNANGLVGALSLGAEGVYMGTRFIATKECPAHINAKQAILNASDTSTIAVRHGSPFPEKNKNKGGRGFVEERRGSIRLLINDVVKQFMVEKGTSLSFEEATASQDTNEESIESNRTVSAFLLGDLENNTISAGQGAGMINDIPSCSELMQWIIKESREIIDRLNTMFDGL